MDEFLRKFDTIRFVAPWSIFRNFFRNFLIFWIQIWILNLSRFGTGPNRNRTGPVWPVTGQTGPVPTGFVNPEHASHSGSEHAHGSASACLVQAVYYTTSSHNWFLKHGLSFSYLFTDNQLDSNSLSFYRDHLPDNLPSSCCKHENTHHISTCLVVESRKTPIPSLACEQPLTSRGSTNQSCSRLVAVVRMNLTCSSGKECAPNAFNMFPMFKQKSGIFGSFMWVWCFSLRDQRLICTNLQLPTSTSNHAHAICWLVRCSC